LLICWKVVFPNVHAILDCVMWSSREVCGVKQRTYYCPLWKTDHLACRSESQLVMQISRLIGPSIGENRVAWTDTSGHFPNWDTVNASAFEMNNKYRTQANTEIKKRRTILLFFYILKYNSHVQSVKLKLSSYICLREDSV